MIEDTVRIHDKLSLEFKIGFNADPKEDESTFAVNTWVFIPNALDINRFTYSKQDFYKDIKSTVRMITPVYTLPDFASSDNLPLQLLSQSLKRLGEKATPDRISEYETQVKMFQSILKSAMREETARILRTTSYTEKALLVEQYANCTRTIAENYRDLRPQPDENAVGLLETFLFGDEFMSNMIELQTYRLLDCLSEKKDDFYQINKSKLLSLVDAELVHKKQQHFLFVDTNSKDNNRSIVHRFSVMKKYIESHLFLNTKKSEDRLLLRQFYYSMAAGISMIFATVIAFTAQARYGNFTLPLFVALVVSYMLKDRIKELFRYYFSSKLDSRFFDNKTDISYGNREIGWLRESQSFVKDQQIPAEALKLRSRSTILEAENKMFDEKILFYRLQLQLSHQKIRETNVYPISGINNILRINLSQFIRKMDDAKAPLYVRDNQDDFRIIEGERIYYLNLIVNFKHLDQDEFKRYRVAFNREGIQHLEQI